jgi:uncharacterized protein (DUF1697 family)
MPVYISMLRAVNVGGYSPIKMDALRELYRSLGLEEPTTYVQSGNVIFRTKATSETALSKKIGAAIAKKFGVQPEVILRTVREMEDVVAANPFAERANIEPAKLHVSFYASDPAAEHREKLSAIKCPEELHLVGRELYIYFPDGAGRSKLPSILARTVKIPITARNWNSVTNMLEIATKMQR